MGACFSVSSAFDPSIHSSSTAKVVSVNGTLLEYPVPITVSRVLETNEKAESFFLCNSDQLNYDEYIPSLKSDHHLEADQIYFVVPVAKLQRRLSATDMAAFAVRASLAIQNASTSSSSSSIKNKKKMNESNSRRRKQNSVSPIYVVKSEPADYEAAEFTIGPYDSVTKKKKAAAIGVSRSGTKIQRYTSRRGLKRADHFKLRLAPIQEGTEVF